MKLKTKLATIALATGVAVGGAAGVAEARETHLNTKDGCSIWIGDVKKPSASTRSVNVSVRCPFAQTVQNSYVGLYQDVSWGADKLVGSNKNVFADGTRLAANTTYERTITWSTSAGNVYGRFYHDNTKWTFGAVAESFHNT